MIVTRSVVHSDILYNIGLVGYWFFFLLGLFGIFSLLYKLKEKQLTWILIYFLLITCVASAFVFGIAHLTASIFIFLIFLKLRETYLSTKNRVSLLLMLAFLIMLLGHLFFMFLSLHGYIYVLAETCNLIAYFVLLFAFVKLIKS